MSCHEDRIAAYKFAAKKARPDLTEAQLEGVWALAQYGNFDGVKSYLMNECGATLVAAGKVVSQQQRLGLCLF